MRSLEIGRFRGVSAVPARRSSRCKFLAHTGVERAWTNTIREGTHQRQSKERGADDDQREGKDLFGLHASPHGREPRGVPLFRDQALEKIDALSQLAHLFTDWCSLVDLGTQGPGRRRCPIDAWSCPAEIHAMP
jgi:hypothetical protein